MSVASSKKRKTETLPTKRVTEETYADVLAEYVDAKQKLDEYTEKLNKDDNIKAFTSRGVEGLVDVIADLADEDQEVWVDFYPGYFHDVKYNLEDGTEKQAVLDWAKRNGFVVESRSDPKHGLVFKFGSAIKPKWNINDWVAITPTEKKIKCYHCCRMETTFFTHRTNGTVRCLKCYDKCSY